MGGVSVSASITWSDVLRQACEVAGGTLRFKTTMQDGTTWRAFFVADDAMWWDYDLDDPALPAYVAELLVAQIVKHDPGNKRLREFDWQLHRRAQLSPSTATAWHRILAAMVALGKMTPEQAQEVE